MKLLVVVLTVVACVGAVAAAAAASCSLAEEFFVRHNASADDGSETVPGPICGGQCCGRSREAKLRADLRKSAEHRFKTTITPLTELLLSTRRTLQVHLLELSRQSHNKTAGFFLQLYRGHAARAHTPLTNLYDDIQSLLRSELNSEELGSRPPKDLADSSRKFFREVFPVAYQGVLKMEAKQFTSVYEECLKAAYDAVLPFGDIPEEMGSSLSRSMEAVRVLLQVLAAGAGALSASERVLASTDEECYNKMLRVNGCSYCRGYNVKPCKNYCLNVARGCIGSLVAELDAPWASYTEGLERLTKPDADMALRELDTQVSKAIMYAMDNHGILESKVRQECGTPATFDLPNSPPHSLAANRRNSLRAPPPYTELLHFAAFLARNKKLFAKIGDDLCDVKNEANEQCWNGDSVGEYTKPLAASASASDQKYNPEVPVSHEDPIVAALGDRLRQARQLLVTYSKRSGVPSAEPFMQGDEAGEEGSGYDKNNDNDEDDDAFYGEGSGDTGSGMEERTQFSGETPPFSSVEPGVSHSDATTSRPILSLVLMTAVSYCLT